VEAAGRFTRYKHGEAVAVGVAFAFRLARRMGRIGDQAVERVESALRAAGLPVRVPAALALQAATLMATDKKRTAGGLLWVLPRAAGDIWKVEWDVAADPGALRETIREIGEGRR
jgi:3-dehydroquinate synthetase